MIKVIFLSVFALCFTGCAGLNVKSTAQRLAVQYAAIKFVEQAQVAPADVKATVAEVRTLLSFETATLNNIKALVMARADKRGLAAADRLLLAALVDAVVASLETKVGNGQLTPDQLYKINAVLDWIMAVV